MSSFRRSALSCRVSQIGGKGRGRHGAVGPGHWAICWKPIGFLHTADSPLVTHPRHRPRDTHRRDRRKQPSQRSTKPARCRPSRLCARSVPSGRGGRRGWSNSGTGLGTPVPGTRIPGVPDAAQRPRLRLDAPAALARARLSQRRPIQRASPAPHRLLGAEARPRPGSYSWPELRQTAEAAFAAGRTPPSRHRRTPPPPPGRAGPPAKPKDDAPLARRPPLDGARAVRRPRSS